jgi:hypothetical protein
MSVNFQRTELTAAFASGVGVRWDFGFGVHNLANPSAIATAFRMAMDLLTVS